MNKTPLSGKKGMVTVYILIGFALIIILSLAMMHRGAPAPLSPPTNPWLADYVESCISLVGHDAIETISEQGGYLHLPEKTSFGQPIHLDKGQDTSPSVSRIEEELSKYVDSELHFCLRNQIDLNRARIEIGAPSTKTTIRENSVAFQVHMLTRTTTGNTKTTTSDFFAYIPSRFWQTRQIAQDLLTQLTKNPQTICISCLFDQASAYQIRWAIQQLTDEDTLYTLTNPRGNPYIYKFVVREEAHK
ncbi:MAG: hypothetical protein AABX47_08280 [Nanoarchaeota archaeon]